MATIYAADPNKLIEEAAKELEKIEELTPPEWAGYVKTGHAKERPPTQENWWYIRAAAILRTIYRSGPIGTSKLRAKFSARKNRGVRPSHTYKASGSVIRKILQQLDKAELTEKVEKGEHKGRQIAAKGQSLLDKIATKLHAEDKKKADEEKKKAAEAKPVEAPKKEEAKPAEKKEAPKKPEGKPTEKPAPAKKPEAAEKKEVKTEEKKEPAKKEEAKPAEKKEAPKKEPVPEKKPEEKTPEKPAETKEEKPAEEK